MTKSKKGYTAQPIKLCPDSINDYFLNLPDTILTPQNIQSSKIYECTLILKTFCKNKVPPYDFKLPFLSGHEVGKLLSKLKNSNALGSDDIPAKFRKMSAPYIAIHLTYVFNLRIDKKYLSINS